MTTTVAAPTARVALFPDSDAEDRLYQALRSASFLGPGLDTLARRTLGRALARRLADMLDVDLVGVLLAGWRAEGRLVDAAGATAANPDDTEHVQLARQRITWSRDTSIELAVDGRPVGPPLTLTLDAELEIGTLDADVAGGRLVALDSGRVTAGIRLSIEGQELRHGSVEFDAPVVLDLGQGIPLVAAAEVVGQPGEATSRVGRHSRPGR